MISQYSQPQGQQYHHHASSSSNSNGQTPSSGRMALVQSSIGGAVYALSNNDDKDTGNGFEFTRRKRWPQLLLQELVGSALFCLKPVPAQRNSSDQGNGRSGTGWGWKMIYASPSVGDMLGQKVSELENRDFFDLVFTPDHPQLHTLFSTLISPYATLTHQPHSNSTVTTSSSDDPTPSPPSSISRSHTTYIRMLTSETEPGKDKGPVVWELRAHATGLDGGNMNGSGSFGLAGSGTMVPQGTEGGEAKGRAVWVMGRKIGEMSGDGEGNGQSLDAFLELKLENERLREELRELQIDMDEYEEPPMRGYVEPVPSRPPQTYHPDLSSDPDTSSAEESSAASSSPAPRPYLSSTTKPGLSRPKPAKPGRPPKDPAAREKKRLKKAALAGVAGAEGEGLHVCVTCGRTDSPEWRKGPLGPKTLCNACGLRWAKRNSTQPTRKERKLAAEKKG